VQTDHVARTLAVLQVPVLPRVLWPDGAVTAAPFPLEVGRVVEVCAVVARGEDYAAHVHLPKAPQVQVWVLTRFLRPLDAAVPS
jgi:hypothetical protein